MDNLEVLIINKNTRELNDYLKEFGFHNIHEMNEFDPEQFRNMMRTVDIGLIIVNIDSRKDEELLKLFYSNEVQIPTLVTISTEALNAALEDDLTIAPNLQIVLKPFDFKTIQTQVKLATQKSLYWIGKKERNEKIWITVKRGIYQSLKLDTIILIERSNQFLKILTEGEDLILVKSSVSDIWKQIEKFQRDEFIQLSRSAIINTNHVLKIVNDGGKYRAILASGDRIFIPETSINHLWRFLESDSEMLANQLAVEIEVPDYVNDEALQKLAKEAVLGLDDIHRSKGGRGLKVSDLQITGIKVPEPKKV